MVRQNPDADKDLPGNLWARETDAEDLTKPILALAYEVRTLSHILMNVHDLWDDTSLSERLTAPEAWEFELSPYEPSHKKNRWELRNHGIGNSRQVRLTVTGGHLEVQVWDELSKNHVWQVVPELSFRNISYLGEVLTLVPEPGAALRVQIEGTDDEGNPFGPLPVHVLFDSA